MKNILETLDDVLLLGPGPSTIPPEVYQALGRRTLGHMDSQFFQLMGEIQKGLRQVMGTANRATITISGTGTAGMEASLVNLIQRRDSMLVIVNGFFAARMADMARRLGAEVDTLDFPWASPIDPEEVEKKLSAKAYTLLGMVHAETSTGVRNPVEVIGPLARKAGVLFIVDAVTSLGGLDIQADQWGIDALYSCSQKCIGCPAGLSPVTFSDQAMKKAAQGPTPVPNYYLDMNLLMKYWDGSPRAYHHTAPANMYFGLYRALLLIQEEGLEAVQKRHREVHDYLVAGLEEMGLSMLVEKKHRLPMLNTVHIPPGVDDGAVRKELREVYKIEIGSGLGELAGKIWRIGLMGYSAQRENVDILLDALKKILKR